VFITTAEWFAVIGSGLLCSGFALHSRRASQRAAQQLRAAKEQIRRERDAGAHLCLSTIEALSYAIEASDSVSIGHLDSVQRGAVAIAKVLELPVEELCWLRAAAMLHNIGRLGVPEHILHKPGSLTDEEQEKLRTHPVLGARIIASVPFPAPVVSIVRHHAEHWDGAGYPDGLKGSAIPLEARILAVANVYSALLQPRPFRGAFAPAAALAEIEKRSGTQFDPGVVVAFRTIASQLRLDAEDAEQDAAACPTTFPEIAASRARDAREALDDIASAQRETQGLFALAQTVGESLHIEAIAETLLTSTQKIVPCSACALFLLEDDGEYLRARATVGTNARHILGSTARIGTYLTGRAHSRGEIKCASFLRDDLLLRDVSDVWTDFRSTLIVPLCANGRALGTINLYHEEPHAFGVEAQRVMRLVATQAGRALDNALQFDDARETANTDALTGLRNARFLREFLERELNRAVREDKSLAVLNIDLDKFKPINDTYGHQAGDQILRDVSVIFSSHVRNYDLAARYAGDEFVIVLTHAGQGEAETVAKKIKASVDRHAQTLITRDPKFPRLGISVGIAVYPDDASDLQGLLCRSDAAMYNDKKQRGAMREAA